ncbi:MAG: hypothetical protein ABW221_21785 [Vicinamibacteria bacterium]
MSRLCLSRAASAAFLFLALSAVRADAAARLTVGGSVRSEDDALVVVVQVDNRGDAAAAPLVVNGELADRYDETRAENGVASGSWTEVTLRFPAAIEQPGVHAVALRLDYQSPPRTGAWISQAAYLLVALGANPPAAVRVTTREAEVETHGQVPVELESADGRAHAVRLRLLTPKGLNAFGDAPAVTVPAEGRVSASLGVLRAGAPRLTRHGVLVLATTEDGGQQAVAVAEGAVVVTKDPALMPRVRMWLLGLAMVLLATAIGVEVSRRWPRPPAPDRVEG